MTNWERAIKFTLANEGGFANIPEDHGGPTNFGITQETYSQWLGRHASVDEVRNMPVAHAKSIYKKSYWTFRFEEIASGPATAIFDWGVLHGPTSSRKLAQQVANALLPLSSSGDVASPLVIDGVIGPKSVRAIASIEPALFVNEYAERIEKWFLSRVKIDPSQNIFLRGWMARAERIRALAKA